MEDRVFGIEGVSPTQKKKRLQALQEQMLSLSLWPGMDLVLRCQEIVSALLQKMGIDVIDKTLKNTEREIAQKREFSRQDRKSEAIFRAQRKFEQGNFLKKTVEIIQQS